ncbi:MAG: hypothetical protein AB7C90_04970 [Bacteroidales bacterium]
MGSIQNLLPTLQRYLLLLLFIGHYGSVALFYHVHIIDGSLVTHSHPFKSQKSDSPFASHGHTTAAFQLIFQVNSTAWANDAVSATPPLPAFAELLSSPGLYSTEVVSPSFSQIRLRAPPSQS